MGGAGEGRVSAHTSTRTYGVPSSERAFSTTLTKAPFFSGAHRKNVRGPVSSVGCLRKDTGGSGCLMVPFTKLAFIRRSPTCVETACFHSRKSESSYCEGGGSKGSKLVGLGLVWLGLVGLGLVGLGVMG